MTNGTYVYDGNGNMAYSVQVNRIYTYTSFNLPSRIFNSNSTSDFIYDADHNRISESYVNGTIIYINPGNVTFFERHKNFNQAGYEIYRFFVHTPSGATIFFSRQSNNGAQAVRFQLKDNLGSTVADVDATGNVVTRYSFDAFGKVRNPNGSATGGTLSQSRRGFTGHEHISVGNSGLIHMNGRVYDATLGRFITADPYIQFADASQSYNRYSYLFNSPLSGTDPTGYRMNTRQIVSVVVAVVVTYLTYGATSSYLAGLTYTGSGYTTAALSSTAVAGLSGAASGAAGAFAGSLVSSRGDVRESLKAAAYGAVGGAIGGAGFNVVGTYASWAANPVGNTLGHALIGCAQASAQGGNCGNGAISAAVGAVASGVGHGLDFDQYQNGVLTVIAGGASASLTGGSFGDGATIALFGYLFNFCAHNGCFDRAFTYPDAFAHGQLGNGAPVTDVDPNTLDWDQASLSYDPSSDLFRANWTNGKSQSGLVFGTLDKIVVNNGTISIPSDRYDYDLKNPFTNKGGFVETFKRDILTLVGRAAQGPSYNSYEIQFRQNAKLPALLNKQFEGLRARNP